MSSVGSMDGQKSWEPNSASSVCRLCGWKWGLVRHRRHHCRKCGLLVCGRCSRGRSKVAGYPEKAVRVCDKCLLVMTAPPTTPSPTLTARKRIPELATTNKVQFATKPAATVKIIENKNEVDSAVLEEAEESGDDDAGEDDDDEPGSAGPGHILQLEEMGLHHGTSQEFSVSNGPNTADSVRTQHTQVTTSTDYDESLTLSAMQEGVNSSRSSSADAKKLKLTLSRFGNMNFSDEESSGPNSAVNTSNATESKQFDFSPPAPLSYVEESEENTSSTAAVTAESKNNEEQRPSEGTSGVATETATTTSATGDAATGSSSSTTATATDVEKSAEKPAAPKLVDATPKNRSKNRLVVRKASLLVPERAEWDATTSTSVPAPVPAPTAKLASHLTPMPVGGSVRRLSTLAPRTPFNSTTTPSPAAAAAATVSVQSPADSAAEGAAGATEASAGQAIGQEGSESKEVPAVDSGATTPVLTVKPMFGALSAPSEDSAAAVGVSVAVSVSASVEVSEKVTSEVVPPAESTGAEQPVRELLSEAASQLAAALEQSTPAVDESVVDVAVTEVVAECAAEVEVDAAAEGEDSSAVDRSESTASDNAAAGNGNGSGKANNKKGAKKNRGRK